MRRIVCVALLSLLVADGMAQRDMSETQKPSDPTVYVTKAGNKYHIAGCQYLSKSKIGIKKAKKKYAPCKKCKPPRPVSRK